MASPRRSGKAAPAGPLSLPELSPADNAALLVAIRTITRALIRPAEVSRLVRIVAEQAAALLGTDSAVVCLLEPGGDAMRVRTGIGSLAACEGELLPLEAGLAGAAVRSGTPQVAEDPRSADHLFRAGERGLPGGPMIALPLRVDERTLGALLVARGPGGERFGEGSLRLGAEVAAMAALALDNARQFDDARGSRTRLEAWRREVELGAWCSRYDTLAEADRKVVFEWNLTTGVFLWGGSVAPVFGYPADEFGSVLDDWSTHLHAEDRERVLEGMRDATERAEPFRLEGRLRHADGSYRRVVVRAGSPIDGHQGSHVIGALDDLTDRGRSTAERERLARLDAAQEIVRGLRHEINNPLAVLLGQVQLLQKEPAVNGDPLLRQSITAISEESSRLDTLMKRLEEVEHSPREPFLDGLGGIDLSPNGG